MQKTQVLVSFNLELICKSYKRNRNYVLRTKKMNFRNYCSLRLILLFTSSEVTVHRIRRCYCSSSVTVHIRRFANNRQSYCSSSVTVHIRRFANNRRSYCSSSVTVHIRRFAKTRRSYCSSSVAVFTDSLRNLYLIFQTLF